MTVDFGRRAIVTELRVQFQGGFAGRDCELRRGGRAGNVEEGNLLTEFHPLDNNSVQVSFHEMCLTIWQGQRII